MAGAVVEDALALWAASLREVKPADQAAPHPGAGGGLGGAVPGRPRRAQGRRETSRMRPEAAGNSGPWRRQALLGEDHRDADALRDTVRDYAVETLAEPDAVLVIDETGAPKQGEASCGVARQYAVSAGKTTNCRTGVFIRPRAVVEFDCGMPLCLSVSSAWMLVSAAPRTRQRGSSWIAPSGGAATGPAGAARKCRGCPAYGPRARPGAVVPARVVTGGAECGRGATLPAAPAHGSALPDDPMPGP